MLAIDLDIQGNPNTIVATLTRIDRAAEPGGAAANAVLDLALDLLLPPLHAVMPIDTGASVAAQTPERGTDYARIYTDPGVTNPRTGEAPASYLPEWYVRSGRQQTPWEEAVAVGAPAIEEQARQIIEGLL